MSKQFFVMSKTNEKVPFDESFPKYSKLISEMLEDQDDENDEVVIPLAYPTEEIARAIEFCKKYDADPYTVPDSIPLYVNDVSKLDKVYPQWVLDLMKMKKKDLFSFLRFVNYIVIEPLIKTCCSKVAIMLRGKNPPEMKKALTEDSDSEEVGEQGEEQVKQKQTEEVEMNA